MFNNYDAELGFQLNTFVPAVNTPGKFENIFNSSVSLASQLISALGKNPNTQITNTGGRVSPIQTPYGSAGTVSNQQQKENQAQPPPSKDDGAGKKGVDALSTAIEGLANSFGLSTTTFALVVAGGVYLLFKKPPTGRR